MATYVVNEKRIGNYDWRIDFYGGLSGSFVYSSKFHGPRTGMEEGFGGSFTVESNDSAYFVRSYPIVVPRRSSTKWTTDKYRCEGVPSGTLVAVRCVSIATDRAYSSMFDPNKGIIAFDFFCGPFSNETCRYELIGDEGLFGPAMAKALSTRK